MLYEVITAHTEARLTLTYYKIDSWDSYETGTVSFEGTQLWSQNYCFCASQTCGEGAICAESHAADGVSCGGSWVVEETAAVSGTIV